MAQNEPVKLEWVEQPPPMTAQPTLAETEPLATPADPQSVPAETLPKRESKAAVMARAEAELRAAMPPLKDQAEQELRHLEAQRAMLAVSAAAMTTPDLWPKIVEEHDRQQRLYTERAIPPEAMTVKARRAEGLGYVDEDTWNGLGENEQIEVIRRGRKTEGLPPMIPHRGIMNVVGPLRGESTSENGPTIRAANILYLSEIMGTSMDGAVPLYDSLVKTLWAGKEPQDVRPLTRLIREWYEGHWLQSQGVAFPEAWHAAQRFAQGEDLDWNEVLTQLPAEAHQAFVEYAYAWVEPKQRGFWGKAVEQFQRYTSAAKESIGSFKVALMPGGSAAAHDEFQKLISEWQAESGKTLPPAEYDVEAGQWRALHEFTLAEESGIAEPWPGEPEGGAPLTEEEQQAYAELWDRAVQRVRDAEQTRRQAVEAAWTKDPVRGEGVLSRAAIATTGLLPDVVASMIAGAKTYGVGSAAYWYARTAPDIFWRLREYGIEDDLAAKVAWWTAVPIALINALQVKQLANLSAAARQKSVRLAELGMHRYLMGKGLAAGKTFVAEMGEEAMESVVEGLGTALAEALSESDVDIDWKGFFASEIEGLKEAFWAMPGLVLGGKALEVSAEHRLVSHLTQGTDLSRPQIRGIVQAAREGRRAVVLDMPDALWQSLPKADQQALLDAASLPEAEQRRIFEDVRRRHLARRYSEAENAAVAVLQANGVRGVVVEPMTETPPAAEGEPVTTGETRLTDDGRLVIRLAYSGYDPETGEFVTTSPEGTLAGPDVETGAHEAFHVIELILPEADLELVLNAFGGDREAAARAFGRFWAEWSGLRKPGNALQRAWAFVAEVLTKVRNAFQLRQFRSYHDVFRAIAEGKAVEPGLEPVTQGRAVEGAVLEQRPADRITLPREAIQDVIKALAEHGRRQRRIAQQLRDVRRVQVRPLKEGVRVRVETVSGETKVGDLYYEDTALAHELKAAERAARVAYRSGRQEEAARQRKHRDELQKRQREIRRQRDRVRKVVKQLNEPIPHAVDFEYRQTIEALTAGMDLRRRAQKTLADRQRTLEFLERHPEAWETIPRRLAEKLVEKPLNDYTLDELEALVRERERLEKQGKLKHRLKEKRRIAKDVEQREHVLSGVLRGRSLEQRKGAVVGPERPTAWQRLRSGWHTVRAWTLRPSRLADLLDGGDATFDGPIHRMLIDDVNEAEAAKQRIINERLADLWVVMQELGITFRMLRQVVHVPGVPTAQGEWTVERMIGVYMQSQNPRGRVALEWGNGLTSENIATIIGMLSDGQKRLGDWMIEAYEERWPVLRQTIIDQTNDTPPHEPRYSPIRRVDAKFATPEQQVLEEVKHRKGLKKGRPARGMTYARKEIPAEYQTPIDLDAVKLFMQQTAITEHYIAFAELVNRLHRVFGHKDVKAAIVERFNDTFNQEIKKYIGRVANPNIYRNFGDLENMARRLRRNMAAAFLAFNAMTVGKQIPSLALYAQEVGFADLVASAMAFARNPRAIIEKVTRRDPQVRDAQIERELEEMRAVTEGSTAWKDRLRRLGMSPIQWVDRCVRVIGWNAVYEHYVTELGEAEAVRRARNVTLRTQPAAAPKDLPGLYTESEFLNWPLMFTNQLNQIYNMWTYDVPRAAFVRGDYGEAVRSSIGLIASAILISAMSNDPERPDDAEDLPGYLAWATIYQQVNSIPLIGSAAIAMRKGWYRENPIIASPAETISAMMRMDWMSALQGAFETYMIYEGLPLVGVKRAWRAVGEKNPAALVGGK